LPHTHDVPGLDIALSGVEVETADPLAGDPNATTRTGAFVPFGSTGESGRRIPAGLPCTAAVMRVRPDGSDLELVAWGLRNAFGLGFLPDGRLLAVDQGADDRGSRPIGNVPDLLFEVTPGAWYGWPDFIGGDPVTDAQYTPERGSPPSFVLANHSELPSPQVPLYRFRSHVAATKFAVAPGASGPSRNRFAIALFGDEKPMTGPAGPKVGRSVAVLDLDQGLLQPLPMEGLARPIDVAYHPVDGRLYILDFGHFEMLPGGRLDATPGSGTLWRSTPIEGGSQ
jgi:glucose/arabinose dehydrogenase